MSETASQLDAFAHDWQAEILKAAPMIAPARQFTYPMQIAGEEDALARGALQLLVRPSAGGVFLAMCALGFTDPSMPSGVYACPHPDELCAVAGGYAYIIDTSAPVRSTHIAMKPVVEVHAVASAELILFVGFHTILAWGANGVAWQSGRLSWEGVRVNKVDGDTLYGTGWNMLTDKDVPFTVDLRTGEHRGGGAA